MMPAVPVKVGVKGRAGRIVVWLRQFTARESLRWARAVKHVSGDEENTAEAFVELQLKTLVAHIERIEVEGDDWPPYPDGDGARADWLDGVGGPVLDELTIALTPRTEERSLGK